MPLGGKVIYLGFCSVQLQYHPPPAVHIQNVGSYRKMRELHKVDSSTTTPLLGLSHLQSLINIYSLDSARVHNMHTNYCKVLQAVSCWSLASCFVLHFNCRIHYFSFVTKAMQCRAAQINFTFISSFCVNKTPYSPNRAEINKPSRKMIKSAIMTAVLKWYWNKN